MLRLPLADALNEEDWNSRRISSTNLSASTEPCPAVWKMNRRSRKQEIPIYAPSRGWKQRWERRRRLARRRRVRAVGKIERVCSLLAPRTRPNSQQRCYTAQTGALGARF